MKVYFITTVLSILSTVDTVWEYEKRDWVNYNILEVDLNMDEH